MDQEAIDNTARQISAQASFYIHMEKRRMAIEAKRIHDSCESPPGREELKDFRDIVNGH